MKPIFLYYLVLRNKLKYLLTFIFVCFTLSFLPHCDFPVELSFPSSGTNINPPPTFPIPPNQFALFADSVIYLNKDSLMLFGHCWPRSKNIDVISYYFRVCDNTYLHCDTYILQENVIWNFENVETVGDGTEFLDTLIMSEYKIPMIKQDSGIFSVDLTYRFKDSDGKTWITTLGSFSIHFTIDNLKSKLE